MVFILEQLYNELKEIRTYLVKIGPKRRQGSVLKNKISEVENIFQRYSRFLIDLDKEIKRGKIKATDILLITESCKNFETLHKDILVLCQSVESKIVVNMNTFNLKTALSLLPIMSDDETSVKQLIDNIQYYDSLLQKTECKQNLINFVLKSRLSQVAKLKLKTEYTGVSNLVADMRSELLPKKAPAAIQNKLFNIKQEELSISEYGKQITELFVDLTISQANGNKESYNILKPLNEKYAIKQFSDGLRNKRLSTIIAARDYTSLKDAIQAAQDEENPIASTSGEILGMTNNSNQFYNSRYFRNNYRGSRGRYNKRWPSDGNRNSNYSEYQGWFDQPSHRAQNSRGRQHRGRFFNRNRGNQGISNHNINTISEPQVSNNESEEKLDTFFRDEQ